MFNVIDRRIRAVEKSKDRLKFFGFNSSTLHLFFVDSRRNELVNIALINIYLRTQSPEVENYESRLMEGSINLLEEEKKKRGNSDRTHVESNNIY